MLGGKGPTLRSLNPKPLKLSLSSWPATGAQKAVILNPRPARQISESGTAIAASEAVSMRFGCWGLGFRVIWGLGFRVF